VHSVVVMASSPWETRPASNRQNTHRPATDAERRKRLEDVWQQHFNELYRRSLSWTNGRREDAEDALGQAAITALQKLPGDLQPEAAFPWLLRLVYSKCMDIHRERKRRVCFVEGLDVSSLPEPEGQGSLESSLLDSELASFIRACIEEMPPRLRSVAEPYLLLDQRYAEIALQLEITEVNVRKRMQEARAYLRGCLQGYLEGRPAARPRKPASRPTAEPRERARASLSALRKYVHRHPRGWKKRLELALRLREEGLLEEAVQHLRLAIERQLGQGALWRELGRTLQELGRTGEAIAAYEEALRRTRDLEALDAIQRELEACRAMATDRQIAARPGAAI
jgi:RNA polymerase sigma factor (sigma-70 family)